MKIFTKISLFVLGILLAILLFQIQKNYRFIYLDRLFGSNNDQLGLSQWMFEYDERYDSFQQGDFVPIIQYNFSEQDNNQSYISQFKFYTAHLSQSEPLLYKGGSKMWKSYKLWQSDDYLVEKIGNVTVAVEVKKDKSLEFAYFRKNWQQENMTYQEFVSKYRNLSSDIYYYYAEQRLEKVLEQDVEEPEFAQIMDLEEINVWQGAAGTISLPHTDGRDNLLCQISGTKELILIPPTQRVNLYIGDDDNFPTNYSPVNFFNPDLKKHPNFAKVKGKMYVKLEAGDILFIPAYWWHHVKSTKERNLAINFWYTCAYMMQLALNGLESEEIF